VSATEGEGALTERAQRQGTRALTGRPGAQGAHARSGIRDLGRVIKIGRRGSDQRGRTNAGGATHLRGGEVAGVEAGARYGGSGVAGIG
jgi:hypothetical protein